jgi:hypothetical protein
MATGSESKYRMGGNFKSIMTVRLCALCVIFVSFVLLILEHKGHNDPLSTLRNTYEPKPNDTTT